MKFSTAIIYAAIALTVGVEAYPSRRQTGFVTAPCRQDSDCQQGCCAFNTGKCAGPAIAQTRDGGCGFHNAKPNCNVAAALHLNDCVAGAVNGDLSSPAIQTAAEFVSQLDNIPFTPTAASAAPPAAAPPAAAAPPPAAAPAAPPPGNAQATVFESCTQDSDCQQGCCAFAKGKCAGPDVAQTNGDGGCGFGAAAPNCNVAAALHLNACIAGAVNGDLSDPIVVAAAHFVSQLDNIPFPK